MSRPEPACAGGAIVTITPSTAPVFKKSFVSSMEPDQVRRQSPQRCVLWNTYSIKNVAPYMVRPLYGAGPSTAPDFQKSWRRTWSAPYMEPDQVQRWTLRNRGAVHGPPPIYGARPSTALDFENSWRRTWSAPYMELDQVRRRTLRNRGAVHGPPPICSQRKYGARI